MARNELLEELWRLAIVATVFQVQRLVIDTLLHRQPVKSSQDKALSLFVRVTVLAAVF